MSVADEPPACGVLLQQPAWTEMAGKAALSDSEARARILSPHAREPEFLPALLSSKTRLNKQNAALPKAGNEEPSGLPSQKSFFKSRYEEGECALRYQTLLWAGLCPQSSDLRTGLYLETGPPKR